MLLGVASSKRLHSKAFLLKTRKASKDEEEILICALQNGCSKTGEILGKSQCRSPILETMSCTFMKTGLHRCHFPRKQPTFLAKQFQENTSARVSFLINCRPACNFIEKEILAQVFSANFVKFLRTLFLTEHLDGCFLKYCNCFQNTGKIS